MMKKKFNRNIKKNNQRKLSRLNLFMVPKFHLKKNCPLTGKNAPEINYKNIKLLKKYLSENGKILPSRVTSVSQKKQRELSLSIKRARILALV
jgi:small subunit ribosomal protein S18